MDFCQTVVYFQKLRFRVETRAKKQNEDIFEKKIKVVFAIFLADNFKWISSENFEQEMRKIF
jgi:hypothetical protein